MIPKMHPEVVDNVLVQRIFIFNMMHSHSY